MNFLLVNIIITVLWLSKYIVVLSEVNVVKRRKKAIKLTG